MAAVPPPLSGHYGRCIRRHSIIDKPVAGSHCPPSGALKGSIARYKPKCRVAADRTQNFPPTSLIAQPVFKRRCPQPRHHARAVLVAALESTVAVPGWVNTIGGESKSLLPVIVLSGFLGAGKTTLLKHILSNKGNLRVAVLVNDLSEVNIDSALMAAQLSSTGEELVSLSNGCICCSIREDLVREVHALAMRGDLDYLVVESTGVSVPLPVAATFSKEASGSFDAIEVNETAIHPHAAGGPAGHGVAVPPAGLGGAARLDSLVTVVDARVFVDEVMAAAALQDRGLAVDEDDDRTVADLMVEQVEFADLLVINKMDLVSEEQAGQVAGLLRKLNATAKIVRASHGHVPLSDLLNTHRFNIVTVQQSPGWLEEINKFEEQRHAAARHTTHSRSSGSNCTNTHDHGPNHSAGGHKGVHDSSSCSHSDHSDVDVHSGELHTTTGSAHLHTGSDSAATSAPAAPDACHSCGQFHCLHTQPCDQRAVADKDAHGASTSAPCDGHVEATRGGSNSSSSSGDSSSGASRSNYGISSFVYFAQRPFHPARLLAHALSQTWPGVLRTKGFFWLATRHDVMGVWQSAGGSWQGEPSAKWLAAIPASERPDDTDLSNWDLEWGDRCQQIVWIGLQMDQAAVNTMLDACLLSDQEMAMGPEWWAQEFEDPLPAWEVHDGQEGKDEMEVVGEGGKAVEQA